MLTRESRSSLGAVLEEIWDLEEDDVAPVLDRVESESLLVDLGTLLLARLPSHQRVRASRACVMTATGVEDFREHDRTLRPAADSRRKHVCPRHRSHQAHLLLAGRKLQVRQRPKDCSPA